MSTPHKHAEILHAVADGKAVHWGFMSQDRWFSENFHLSMLQDEGYKFRVAPHRWQAEIDAIKAGVAVQGRRVGSMRWLNQDVWDFDQLYAEFRIKPEMLRYRVGLFSDGAQPAYFLTADNEEHEKQMASRFNFLRWIGDWQEVEA